MLSHFSIGWLFRSNKKLMKCVRNSVLVPGYVVNKCGLEDYEFFPWRHCCKQSTQTFFSMKKWNIVHTRNRKPMKAIYIPLPNVFQYKYRYSEYVLSWPDTNQSSVNSSTCIKLEMVTYWLTQRNKLCDISRHLTPINLILEWNK